MLIQFSFKNFKVFKEEVLLDFLPASINEHKNTLLKDPADGECILPLIGIYGPNSGGKSTVLNALSCLSSLVTASVTVPTRIKDVHCLFSSDCKDIPTQFDVGSCSATSSSSQWEPSLRRICSTAVWAEVIRVFFLIGRNPSSIPGVNSSPSPLRPYLHR